LLNPPLYVLNVIPPAPSILIVSVAFIALYILVVPAAYNPILPLTESLSKGLLVPIPKLPFVSSLAFSMESIPNTKL